MKKLILFFLILLLMVFGCYQSKFYTLTVLEKHEPYLSFWLEEGSGIDTEERYNGILLKVLYKNKKIGEIVAYQPWFSSNRLEYPAVGTELKVDIFDFKKASLGWDEYNIKYSELIKLEKD